MKKIVFKHDVVILYSHDWIDRKKARVNCEVAIKINDSKFKECFFIQTDAQSVELAKIKKAEFGLLDVSVQNEYDLLFWQSFEEPIKEYIVKLTKKSPHSV